jgi:uncharacterized protein YdaU (DUF1376 family)
LHGINQPASEFFISRGFMGSSKKDDLPAMPFYVGDWLKAPDVQCLSYELKGIWFEMLCYMWESKQRGVLNYTTEELARLLRMDTVLLEQKLKQLSSKNIFSVRESDGLIFCRRMVRDQEIREIRIKSGKKGGENSFASRFAQAKSQAKAQANTEDEDEDENISLTLKEEDCKEEIKTWRTDYQIYRDECSTAFQKYASDEAFIAQRQLYHPNLNIPLSINKAFNDFWGKDAGWKNKKASKTKKIDWEATIINALSQKCNQVWMQK